MLSLFVVARGLHAGPGYGRRDQESGRGACKHKPEQKMLRPLIALCWNAGYPGRAAAALLPAVRPLP
jgi:hypothetical protein